MQSNRSLLLVLTFLQNLITIRCLTPKNLDIHAVLITSEYIKPDNICEENVNHSFNKVNTTERLQKLRKEMFKENIHTYIILSNDEHQSETVSDHDKRLKYISGFSGSNGLAVVTRLKAALWTDSRYFLQAYDEMDCNWILMKMGVSGTPTVDEWIASQLKEGESASTDPKICAYEKWNSWEKKLNKSGIEMKLVESNLIDRIWTFENGRPPALDEPIYILDVKFAGVTWQEKLNLIRQDMRDKNIDTFVVSALDEIAWTLNLRGGDILYFPVFRSYLIIQMSEATLYVSQEKITSELIEYLNANCTYSGQSVRLRNYNDIWRDLTEIGKRTEKTGFPAKFSYFSGINYLLYSSIPEDKISLIPSPILIRKDYKNDAEIQGMKMSHIRDGLVVCQFLAQLEEDITAGNKSWTELKAVNVLSTLREKQKYNAGLSFATIAAFGKNAANAHYQPSPETDTPIDDTQLFMLDSGGQYYDGTTDCTRTVHFGVPRETERDIYTRLLIGCIDVATVTFKNGYTLKQLEILIRAPLYEKGLDYGHGSTHGIGSFLAVHEAFNETYHLNFFGSQEPGYYKDNDFGMRLENIVTIVKAPGTENSKDKFYTFETVTLIPYEKKLIKTEMLEKRHIKWLNKYNAKVRKLVGEEMLKQGLEKEYKWLLHKTEPFEYST